MGRAVLDSAFMPIPLPRLKSAGCLMESRLPREAADLKNHPQPASKPITLDRRRALTRKRFDRPRLWFGRTRNWRAHAGLRRTHSWSDRTHTRHHAAWRIRPGMQRTDDRPRCRSRAGSGHHICRAGHHGIWMAAIIVTGRVAWMRRRRRQTTGEGNADGERNGEECFHDGKVCVFSRERGRLHSK